MSAMKFWMVWNSQGRGPTFRHPSPDRATSEAERLARLNPGQDFYVLEATTLVRKQDVDRIELTDIPF